MAKFKYDLEAKVIFEDNIEIKGVVIGRAEYLSADNKYLIRYADGTGTPCENWWDEDAITEDEDAGDNDNDRDRERD